MKSCLFFLVLFAASGIFAQGVLPDDKVKEIEARMTTLKSSLFLLDSLYGQYTEVAKFTVRDKEQPNRYQSGSSWLYNRYVSLGRKYHKCNECKLKADELTQLINRENREDMDVQYLKIIQKADDYFQQENFPKAKEYYQRAVTLKPSDSYPKQRLDEMDSLLTIRNQKEYDALIFEADRLFASKDWVKAKESYLKALAIKTKEVYPMQKVKEIDELISKQSEKN